MDQLHPHEHVLDMDGGATVTPLHVGELVLWISGASASMSWWTVAWGMKCTFWQEGNELGQGPLQESFMWGAQMLHHLGLQRLA